MSSTDPGLRLRNTTGRPVELHLAGRVVVLAGHQEVACTEYELGLGAVDALLRRGTLHLMADDQTAVGPKPKSGERSRAGKPSPTRTAGRAAKKTGASKAPTTAPREPALPATAAPKDPAVPAATTRARKQAAAPAATSKAGKGTQERDGGAAPPGS